MPRSKEDAARFSRFTVEIPIELKVRLEKAVVVEDRSATAVVRRALEAYMAKSEADHAD